MKLHPYEYRDPRQVLEDVFEREPLDAGSVVLALVREPSRDPEVLETVRLMGTWSHLDRYRLSRQLETLADGMTRLPAPARIPPDHSIMTIVARHGFAIIGPAEGRLGGAWLYANVFAPVYKGDVLVVIPNGWADFTT